ncbi:type ISP restriction/modification enzyme [Elioraea sp.]|uniref:type ISP restriction/modification enzyme n=1 Tax=Elioraea sp. TaxID=2185103 RepID=UPI003F713074
MAAGLFSKAEKETFLERVARGEAALSFVRVERGGLDDFLPEPFADVAAVSIADAFRFRSSGTQTKRDEFVYGFTAAQIERRVKDWLASTAADAEVKFHSTAAKPWTAACQTSFETSLVLPTVYRPLDRRFHYAHPAFNDRLRPELRAAWGASNIALYAMPSGTGAGPAAWVHGLIPDYHAFRGSYGGYAFPLYDRRNGPAAHNLNPDLLRGLEAAYARHVRPEDVFHAVTTLLSATSYTRRFAWDLEEAFPHIPFPADPAVFEDAARIGAEIAALETFARQPAEAFRTARLAGRATGVTLWVPPIGQAFRADGSGSGAIPLQEDGSLRLAGVPERVFAFGVSGYRVLYRWLAARADEALAEVQRDALDVAWRLTEVLHWFDQADPVLEAALARPLTRAELGL